MGFNKTMIYTEYNLKNTTVDKIYNSIYKYKGEDVSKNTCTENGFQTSNIIKLFDKNLLKKILPIKEISDGIFHIHYIKYYQGGLQKEHDHVKTEQYSFIVYLNNADDGCTVLKDPINKKIFPQKGKVIVFDAKILHYAEKSSGGKEVIVGAINEKIK